MALAQEVAPKGDTVNAISSGYIATEMVLGAAKEIRSANRSCNGGPPMM